MTAKIEQKCIDHVEEEKDYFRFLLKLKPPTLEEINYKVDNSAEDSEENVEKGIASLVQD